MPADILKAVLDALQSPLGQTLLLFAAMSFVTVLFQLFRAALRWAKDAAKRTPTKLDDEVVESLSDAVDAAEPQTKKMISDLLKAKK